MYQYWIFLDGKLVKKGVESCFSYAIGEVREFSQEHFRKTFDYHIKQSARGGIDKFGSMRNGLVVDTESLNSKEAI